MTMNKTVGILSCLALLLMATVCLADNKHPFQPTKPLSEDESRELFTMFKTRYEKQYADTQEHENRYNIFKQNLKRIIKGNQMEEPVYGVTKFADLTKDEFKQMYLMKTQSPAEVKEALFGAGNSRIPFTDVRASNGTLPQNFDWRKKGAVTHVKNQGACGSCWAFSVTGNLEGQLYLARNQLKTLSEQQLVDCDHHCTHYRGQKVCDQGCGGGLQWNAYQYLMKAGGIESESSYPYTAHGGQCKFNPSDVVTRVTNYTMLPSDEHKMAQWLYHNGPIAIAINAEWLQIYFGGISDPWWCSPNHLDHGVLIVGFGKGKNWLGEELKYWIIKNSWGEDWGESGYFKIVRNKGKCGLNKVPSSGFVTH